MRPEQIASEIGSMVRDCIGADAKFEHYWSHTTPSLRACVVKAAEGCRGTAVSDTERIDLFSEGMNEFLYSYPAPAIYKQDIRRTFLHWLKVIDLRQDLGIGGEDMEQRLIEMAATDTGVALLKSLHDRNGKSKAEIGKEIGIGEKAVQTDLRKLCPDLIKEDGRTPPPMRLGGQALYADIRVAKRKSAGDGSGAEKRFFTPDTVHPVVLQMNMMQVGCLLRSLCHAYSSEITRVSLQLAVDVWMQLSDYGKNRVREVFVPQDDALGPFIEKLEGIASGNELLAFLSEEEMRQDEENANLADRLLLAYKGGMKCDVQYRIREEQHVRHDQRIEMVFRQGKPAYRILPFDPADAQDKGITVAAEQIEKIVLLS